MGSRKIAEAVIEEIETEFSLQNHIDVNSLSARFDLEPVVVKKIARKVQQEEGPPLQVTVRQSEHELKEQLRLTYARHIATYFFSCNWKACSATFKTDLDAFAHRRLHLAFDSEDHRVQRAALQDIDQQIFSRLEREASSSLDDDERREIIERLRSRGRLPGVEGNSPAAPQPDAQASKPTSPQTPSAKTQSPAAKAVERKPQKSSPKRGTKTASRKRASQKRSATG